MREFAFNTGVRPESGSKLFGPYQEWRGGVKIIKLWADVPDGCDFLFACDNPDLPESSTLEIIVAPITGGLVSKFGYFRSKA